MGNYINNGGDDEIRTQYDYFARRYPIQMR